MNSNTKLKHCIAIVAILFLIFGRERAFSAATASVYVRLDSVDASGPEEYNLSLGELPFDEDENSGPRPFVWNGRMRTAATVEISGYSMGFGTSAFSTIPWFTRFGAEASGTYTLPFQVSRTTATSADPLPATIQFVGSFDGAVTIVDPNAIHLGYLTVGGSTLDLDAFGFGTGIMPFNFPAIPISANIDSTTGNGALTISFSSFSSTLSGAGLDADFTSTFQLFSPEFGSLPAGFSVAFDGQSAPPPTVPEPATALLIVFGSIGLGLRRHKRA